MDTSLLPSQLARSTLKNTRTWARNAEKPLKTPLKVAGPSINRRIS